MHDTCKNSEMGPVEHLRQQSLHNGRGCNVIFQGNCDKMSTKSFFSTNKKLQLLLWVFAKSLATYYVFLAQR